MDIDDLFGVGKEAGNDAGAETGGGDGQGPTGDRPARASAPRDIGTAADTCGGQSRLGRGDTAADRHYRLAMRAARRIARTRARGEKARAGSLVCRHLQAMLAAEDSDAAPASRAGRLSRVA